MENEKYLYSDLTKKIIGAAYYVSDELGFGFLESVYERALELILIERGHDVIRQAEIPVYFKGERIGDFRADLIIDQKVIVELKAGKKLHSIHEAQILNYLRATEIEVGLLFNFGEELKFKRKIFTNDRKSLQN